MRALVDAIEGHLWLASAYRLRHEHALAREALDTAWRTYLANVTALREYCGTELSDKIVRAMAEGPAR